MVEIFLRIMAGIVAIISFSVFFGVCMKRPIFGLGFIIAGICFGIFWPSSIFAVVGAKELTTLLFLGIFTGIFGGLIFFLIWMKYDLIPRQFQRHRDNKKLERN